MGGTHPTRMHSCVYYFQDVIIAHISVWYLFNFYRPQTKFAKVMFLHLSVILFTGGGLHAGEDLHPGGSASKGVWQTPSPSDTTGYGQRAGGTHPTGMHSFFTALLGHACLRRVDFI